MIFKPITIRDELTASRTPAKFVLSNLYYYVSLRTLFNFINVNFFRVFVAIWKLSWMPKLLWRRQPLR